MDANQEKQASVQGERILSRQMARELSIDEIDAVAGGHRPDGIPDTCTASDDEDDLA